MVKLTQPFAGFHSPSYTQVPDDLFDQLLPDLTESELKVLLYIVRRTFGFKKRADAITLEQLCSGITRRTGEVLDRGTGLKRPTVLQALRALKEAHIINALPTMAADGGSGPTLYSLNVLSAHPGEDDPRTGPAMPKGVRVDIPRGMPGHTPGVSVDIRGGSADAYPQQTGQQTDKQDTPLGPPRGGRTRRQRSTENPHDPERYTRGAYGVCPQCGCSPHDAECPLLAQEEATTVQGQPVLAKGDSQ